MRVIVAFFGPYAPEALTAHVSVFSHNFKSSNNVQNSQPVQYSLKYFCFLEESVEPALREVLG